MQWLTLMGLITSAPLMGSGSFYSDPTLQPHESRFGRRGTCARVLWEAGKDQDALKSLQTVLAGLASRGQARVWELTALAGESTQRKLVVETSDEAWATLLQELERGRWGVKKNRVYPIGKWMALGPTVFGLGYLSDAIAGVAYFFQDDPVLEFLTTPARWIFSPPVIPPGSEASYICGKFAAVALMFAAGWSWTMATEHQLEREVGHLPAAGETVPFYILRGMRGESFYKNRRRVPVYPDAIPLVFREWGAP